jgi:hypothetical protein
VIGILICQIALSVVKTTIFQPAALVREGRIKKMAANTFRQQPKLLVLEAWWVLLILDGMEYRSNSIC